ncbi:hypothetical protein QC823_15410 [Halomonas vilamensis]|uniref:Uncharacterized protein n=1 Tax=Vreelandella vilamensis TaxID=531309 RepID=A0ABU1H7R8_9GAMM|nr:hypothetical protein [Halomonas vilamensis]MDR5900352.1 hypothetical protein [Halomonas vilamensis]
MTRFNLQALANTAQRGEGYQHLTPGQAWNAHALGMKPKQLTNPLSPLLSLVFGLAEQKQRADFGEPSNAPCEMFNAAFDKVHPPYVRLSVLNRLREGVKDHLLGLAPPGVDSGYRRFSLAEVARVLDTTEGELLALAEATGTADQLRDRLN